MKRCRPHHYYNFMISHSKKCHRLRHVKLSQRIAKWDRIRAVFGILDNICLDMRASSYVKSTKSTSSKSARTSDLADSISRITPPAVGLDRGQANNRLNPSS